MTYYPTALRWVQILNAPKKYKYHAVYMSRESEMARGTMGKYKVQ